MIIFYNKKTRFLNKNVIITGGSSGIGLSIALEFAKLGANLFLLARHKERLKKTQKYILDKFENKIKVIIISVDISKEEKVSETIKNIGDNYNGIHTLINNAGIMGVGKFQDNTIKELKNIMNINYFGAVYATKAAFPYLKDSIKGHIGFVSSVAGYTGLFGYTSYAPTKFAMTGLAECIRMEAKDYDLGVTIVFPTDTRTPMYEYEQANTLSECKALSKNASLLPPDIIAKKFVAGIRKYQFEVLCNFESKIIKILKALLPNLYYWIVDRIIKKDRMRRKKFRPVHLDN